MSICDSKAKQIINNFINQINYRTTKLAKIAVCLLSVKRFEDS